MNPRLSVVGGFAALLFAVGLVLAVTRPGDLGDEDGVETAASTTSSSTDTTGTTAATVESTTTSASTSASTTPSTATSGAGASSTTTTAAGGGPDSSGSGSVADEVANTGGPEWLLPIGGLLLGVGLVSRRLATT